MSKLRIGVVGAGIGGLAFATAIARYGADVTVFDQFAAPRPVGSGLVIQPVGQAVLRELDALDMALANGNRIYRMVGREAASDRRVLDVTYDAPGDPSFGLAIHRAALFEPLFAQASDSGVRIVPDHTVTQVETSRRDGSMLHFAESDRAGPFDLIVDASGAGSVLSPLVARPLGYGALWATVDWPEGTALDRMELRQVYLAARNMVGVLPIGTVPGQTGRKAAIFWSLRAGSYEAWRANGLAAWRAQAQTLWPAFEPFAEQVRRKDQMTMARYSHGTLSRPFGQGIAYIGDAAHRASPQLGQGANMALLDASALAMALDKAVGDVDLALQYYAQSRRWHVRAYQAMSWAFTPQYQSDSHVLPWLRDHVLFPVSQQRPFPGMLSRLVRGDLIPRQDPLGKY